MRFIVAALAAIVVTGCQTKELATPPPKKQQTPCETIVEVMTDPRADADTKMLAREVGRNRGCFGQPQTHRVQIDQTIRMVK